MQTMGREEARAFLEAGTRTGKLATVRDDGRPHVAPIWFVVDGDELVFTTMESSVKGRNLLARPDCALSVDDERFPFAFALVEGRSRVLRLAPSALKPWTTRIARRYVGEARAEAYGERNAVDGELLVRLPMTKLVARRDVAG